MADFANVQPDEYKLLGCNFSAGRPFGIKGVTIHHMAGDLNAAQCNSIWAANGCSAHYSVDRNGYIVQHVNDTDRAYACGDGIGTGGGNDTTISIEHANTRAARGRSTRRQSRAARIWSRPCACTTASVAPSGARTCSRTATGAPRPAPASLRAPSATITCSAPRRGMTR